MEFLTWFYSKGIEYYFWSWNKAINWALHYFSLCLLIKTLFHPWKRLTDADDSPGFNLQKKFESFTFNLVSVFVGAGVRLTLFFVGIVFILGIIIGGAIGFLFWLIMPFFGVAIYQKYQKQPQNFVYELIFRLKSRQSSPLDILLFNEAGDFVAKHVGIPSNELIQNANLSNVNWDQLAGVKYEDIINFLLNSNVWTPEFLSMKEVSRDDLINSARWWDQRQLEMTKFGDDEFGRPGIALELTYGYTPTLNKYSLDLSAPQSFSHHLIGRSAMVSRLERVLSSGSSVLLVGPPGVGKKTVVLEFAEKAITGQLGKNMAFKRVLELDYNSLLSDVKDLNLKKNTLSSILSEASNAGNIILMIRDIHRLTNPNVEGYDFTDIFEAHLEKRDLKIIAVSVDTEYEKYIAPNMRLRKFLERVEITPPSKEEALQIIFSEAKRWEKLTGFVITIPALRHIIDESDRYITDVPFPEKALEFLDAVITYKQSLPTYKQSLPTYKQSLPTYKQSLPTSTPINTRTTAPNVVTKEDVNAVLAEKTGISFAKLTDEDQTRLGNIEELIHERLISQENAVSLIGRTLRSRTIGVIKENKPLGSFLFLGPTGVGKTETAKVLAKVYFGSEDKIIRFDMAEYSGREGLERLIGSVSANQPGALTTAIKNHPSSLLLLDEIEKSSKEITNLFLALLDEGTITDAFDRKIICRNLFVVGTSNAGAEYIRKLVETGVKGEELQKSVVNKILEDQIFSPEFLNRFDGVVVYEPLGKEELKKIAKLMLLDLAVNLRGKNIYLEVTDDVAEKLAEDGYEPSFGARAMRRIVNMSIGDAISKALIGKYITEGSRVKLVPGNLKGEFSVMKLT